MTLKISFIQNNFKQVRQIALLTWICLVFNNIWVSRGNQCGREEDSETGVVLLNYTYNSSYTESYGACLEKCLDDVACHSLNFWFTTMLCELNNRTKYLAAPRSILCAEHVLYMGMMRKPEPKKILYRSCRDVHPSCGDGEYPIEPTGTSKPFIAYCDMTTDGGGWTLLYRSVLKEPRPNPFRAAASYEILNEDKMSYRYLASPRLKTLRQEISYSQLRYYCYKKSVGRVFHIMTGKNGKGEDVVRFFTDDVYKANRPESCDSFTVLPDDTSVLSQSCSNWGFSAAKTADGLWGVDGRRHDRRLFHTPAMVLETYHSVSMQPYPTELSCDDYHEEKWNKTLPLSVGDTWEVYLR